jgi:NADH-quinone oxidoreductase subunit L
MTSFYMFRLWFLTFFGKYRGPNPDTTGHGHDTDAPAAGHAGAVHDAQDAHAASDHGHGSPHESPWVMGGPRMILALLSLVGGWVGVPHSLHGSDRFGTFLSPVVQTVTPVATAEAPSAPAEEESSSTELIFSAVSVTVAALGFILAWYLYYKRPDLPPQIAKSFGGLYTLVLNKYKIDELYGAVIIHPLISLSTNVFWKGIDKGLIDGAVDGGAAGAQETSDAFRQMQSGNIRSYAGWVAVGATAVIAFMVWRGLR